MSISTTIHEQRISTSGDAHLEYRAIHTGAILGLLLGIVSIFIPFTAMSSFEGAMLVSPIAVLGMFVSLRAWARINNESELYTGRGLAQAGLALSLLFLVTGLGYGGYVYSTEVPDGYSRISFADMKPDENQIRSSIIVPPKIQELEGAKVFIKGYIRPDSVTVRKNIDRFLLVRDNQQCCFGDLSQVNYFDQVQVQLTGPLKVDYSTNLYRIAGTLEINPENLARGSSYPIFSLRADYAK
jgi:hypothetical protein